MVRNPLAPVFFLIAFLRKKLYFADIRRNAQTLPKCLKGILRPFCKNSKHALPAKAGAADSIAPRIPPGQDQYLETWKDWNAFSLINFVIDTFY